MICLLKTVTGESIFLWLFNRNEWEIHGEISTLNGDFVENYPLVIHHRWMKIAHDIIPIKWEYLYNIYIYM